MYVQEDERAVTTRGNHSESTNLEVFHVLINKQRTTHSHIVIMKGYWRRLDRSYDKRVFKGRDL